MSFLFNFDQFYEKRDDDVEEIKIYHPPYNCALEELLQSILHNRREITEIILNLNLPITATLEEDKEIGPTNGDYIPSEINIHALLHGTLDDAKNIEKLLHKNLNRIRFRLSDKN